MIKNNHVTVIYLHIVYKFSYIDSSFLLPLSYDFRFDSQRSYKIIGKIRILVSGIIYESFIPFFWTKIVPFLIEITLCVQLSRQIKPSSTERTSCNLLHLDKIGYIVRDRCMSITLHVPFN